MRGLVLLVGLTIVPVSFAQIRNVDITGAGARAEGMAGAFIGVADDATSIVWNPAGLTSLERPEASLVGRQVFDNYDFGSFGDDNSKHFILNFASFAYPVNVGERRLTFALAFQNQIDLYQFSNQGGQIDEQTGGVNTISPGVGFQVNKMFSIGAVANIWTGSSEYRDPSDDGFDDDWSGFNFQLGGLADFSAMNERFPMKLGISYRSGFDLKDKYELTAGGDGEWTWHIPWMLGFGASYRIGEDLTMAVDYETRAFKDAKVIDKDADVTLFTLSDYNVNLIRIGAEYLVVTDAFVIPLRAGFKTGGTVFSEFISGDQVRVTGFTLGTGYIHPRFAFDVALNIDRSKDPTIVKYSQTRISASTIVYF